MRTGLPPKLKHNLNFHEMVIDSLDFSLGPAISNPKQDMGNKV